MYLKAIQFKLANLKIYSFLYTGEVIVFTILFCKVYHNHWDIMQTKLKCTLLLFELLLIAAWINTGVMYWAFTSSTLRTRYLAYVETFVFDNINGSIFLILFFKVLFTFKQVEVQINPKYESADRILETLQKFRVTERLTLSIKAVMALLAVTMWVTSHKSNEQKVIQFVNTIVIYSLFFLNLYLVSYFHRMAMFYINTLA